MADYRWLTILQVTADNPRGPAMSRVSKESCVDPGPTIDVQPGENLIQNLVGVNFSIEGRFTTPAPVEAPFQPDLMAPREEEFRYRSRYRATSIITVLIGDTWVQVGNEPFHTIPVRWCANRAGDLCAPNSMDRTELATRRIGKPNL